MKKCNELLQLVLWTAIMFCVTWGSRLSGPTVGGVTLFPIRIIFIVAMAVYILRIVQVQNGILKLNSLTTKILPLFLWGLLTSLWSAYSSSTVTANIVYLTSFVTAIMCKDNVEKNHSLKILCSSVYINVIIMSLIAIRESVTGEFLNLTYVDYVRSYNMFGLRKPIAAFYNTNNLTVYLLLSLPIMILAAEEWKHSNIFKLIAIMTTGFVILLTGSRTGVVGLLIFVAMYLYFNTYSVSKTKKSLGIIVLLLAIAVFIYFSPNVLNIVLERDLADEGRWLIWKESISSAWKYYFIGSAPGTCTLINGSVGPAHNFFIEILCEYGLIGLVLSLLIFKDLIPSRRLILQAPQTKYFFIFVVLFVISSVCVSSMQGYYFLWAYIGIGYGLMSLQTVDRKENGRQIEYGKTIAN